MPSKKSPVVSVADAPVSSTVVPFGNPATPPKLDENLLADVYDSSKTAESFMYVSPDEAGPLVAAGLILTNPGLTDGSGKIAARTTDAGNEYLRQNAPGLISPAEGEKGPEANNENAPASSAAQVRTPTKKPTISSVVDFAMPEAGKRGGARPETYPFSKLEVGKAFFIPATAEVPNPVTAYASTVASATKRYEEEVEGTRVTRKNNVVKNTKQTRVFAIRPCPDGAPFGEQFKGVAGAAVGRIQ